MRVIVGENQDGTVDIIIPADPQQVEALRAVNAASYARTAIVNDTDLPQDRSTRNSWTFDGTKVNP